MSQSARPRRGPVGEIVAILVGLAIAILAVLAVNHYRLSVVSLERELGPKRYSEENEELLIRHFFRDRRFGVFVDVGAGHYLQGSNTYFLEKELGWRGVAIDANTAYAADYVAHRPNTQFFGVFVSDRSDEQVDFFLVPNNPTRSSGSAEAVAGAGRVVTEKVRTATLNDLLRSNSITRFDFLSLDIELGEPKALAGLDLEVFHPELVCVEAYEPVQREIADYFARRHYHRLEDYLTLDQRNWYFTPN
jgi:FkbM family methyltransferase